MRVKYKVGDGYNSSHSGDFYVYVGLNSLQQHVFWSKFRQKAYRSHTPQKYFDPDQPQGGEPGWLEEGQMNLEDNEAP